MTSFAAYLSRINYSGPVNPTEGTLCALHRAHMLAVPFENLDIALQRPVLCDENAALYKIVDRKRGGFCYELNGAFAWLLREVGFHVTLLSARVGRSDGSLGPEFDHLALRVDLDQPWLADVGFGDSFLEPLRLRPAIEQIQLSGKFRISASETGMQVEKLQPDGWKVEYTFTLQPRELSEFEGMCQFHQTSPESHFTRHRICTLARANGRTTLSNLRLIETRDGKRGERELSGEEEWRKTLRQEFGVEI